MQTLLRTFAILSLGLGGLSAQAAEATSPAAQAETIAPLLDSQTLGLVYLDLGRLDLEPLTARLQAALPATGPERRLGLRGVEWLQAGSALTAALRQAGVREAYLVLNLEDLPLEPPFLAIPAGQPKVETLGLASLGYTQAKQIGKLQVLGGPKTLARLAGVKPEPRPELAKAFEAAGAAPVQLLLLPTRQQREILRQMLPLVPAEVGGQLNEAIAQGAVWASLGLSLPPQASLRAVIQSENERAAQTLHTALGQLARQLTEAASKPAKERRAEWVARKYYPQIAKILEAASPAVEGSRLVAVFDEKSGSLDRLVAAVCPAVQGVFADRAQAKSMHNLKMLGLAMHNYLDKHKQFPPHASRGPDGKPLLSWRVLILPYVDGQQLYSQFHLDEPWDSEHNRKLIDQMPAVYRSPALSGAEKGRTSYVVPVGKETMFPEDRGLKVGEITDGTSETIMTLEVPPENAVIWTKPDDLAFDPDQPTRGLGEVYPGREPTGFADGSVMALSTEELANPKYIRARLTATGGEVIRWTNQGFQVEP